jgi:hypothetical protein
VLKRRKGQEASTAEERFEQSANSNPQALKRAQYRTWRHDQGRALPARAATPTLKPNERRSLSNAFRCGDVALLGLQAEKKDVAKLRLYNIRPAWCRMLVEIIPFPIRTIANLRDGRNTLAPSRYSCPTPSHFLNRLSKACLASVGRNAFGVEVSFSTIMRME